MSAQKLLGAKPSWTEPMEPMPFRFGTFSMKARLYILTGHPEHRKELIRAINEEFDPAFYKPIPEEE